MGDSPPTQYERPRKNLSLIFFFPAFSLCVSLQSNPLVVSVIGSMSSSRGTKEVVQGSWKAFQKAVQIRQERLRPSKVLCMAGAAAAGNSTTPQQHVHHILTNQFNLRTIWTTEPKDVMASLDGVARAAAPTTHEVAQVQALRDRVGATTLCAVGTASAMYTAQAVVAAASPNTVQDLMFLPTTYSAVLACHLPRALLLDVAEETLVPTSNPVSPNEEDISSPPLTLVAIPTALAGCRTNAVQAVAAWLLERHSSNASTGTTTIHEQKALHALTQYGRVHKENGPPDDNKQNALQKEWYITQALQHMGEGLQWGLLDDSPQPQPRDAVWSVATSLTPFTDPPDPLRLMARILPAWEDLPLYQELRRMGLPLQSSDNDDSSLFSDVTEQELLQRIRNNQGVWKCRDASADRIRTCLRGLLTIPRSSTHPASHQSSSFSTTTTTNNQLGKASRIPSSPSVTISWTHNNHDSSIAPIWTSRTLHAALRKNHVIRAFVSTKHDDERNSTPSSDTPGKTVSSSDKTATAASPPLREKLSLSKSMDPDFQRYLTGEMPVPVDHRPRRRRYRLPDPDKELFARIQKKQRLQKEEARIRTAYNVNRALMGNVVICSAKLGAWLSSGSSGMLAEFIHSVVDCGNQALLLVGLRDSRLSPDPTHPYGYGKSVYFWALVSALGTFFLGAGVSMTHAIGDVMDPSLQEITWHVWGVLLLSLAVDGYVLGKTLTELRETKPAGISFYRHMSNLRDPATLAILLEDGAACLGVLLALGGIVATHVSGNPIFDGLAGVGISSLLGGMGIILVRVNHRFLLGQSVDKEIIDDINKILLSRRSIDSIGSVQSQWTGPDTFSYKAEVDFDGTYLAATLMKFYQQEFMKIKDTMEDELQVLLAFYSEDVMRTVEREVRKSEALIRQKYPGAEYIELEPMSVDVDRLAIDDNLEAELRRVEGEALDRFLRTIRAEAASSNSGASSGSGQSSAAEPSSVPGESSSSSSPSGGNDLTKT